VTAGNSAPDPASVLWDVVVVGTGMGGATAGYELARLGRRVLFLEKGLPRGTPAAAGEDEAAARLRDGPLPPPQRGRTSFGDAEFHAPLGCGVGGTTTLYAAALERFTPADFRPRANYPEAADATLPEAWPVGYEELLPYYERAETLFRVSGTADPLAPGPQPALRTPPPLSARDAHLFEVLRGQGLHPYRIHAGYEFVAGCSGCAAGPCLRGCKSDAGRICIDPALERHGAQLLTGCEVLGIEAGADRVDALHCSWNGRAIRVKARVIVLAAGAFMTPVLLLNSGLANRSGLVGRNLMLHVSDFIALSPRGRFSGDGPQKSLALNDLYQAGGRKLGTFQTAGAAVEVGQIMQYMRDVAERDPAWWRKLASPRPAWWRRLSSPAVRAVALFMYYGLDFRNAAVWASVIEDLPYHDNRVVADPGAPNGMRFEYRYPDELRERVRLFRARLAQALGPVRAMVLSGENNLNYGHVCGTCRFGDDPATSVLDRDNRAHGVDNLYVVDASFFPSSGGTNPSLTIAANALRAAAAIDARLG
jgi:choline dehydrogenase-like flavoprotein